MKPFLINFVPTGMVPTKVHSPHVPISPQEIISEVLEARKFGISIVHLHVRDKNGHPCWKKESYEEIIDGIRSEDGYTNDSLIICVSTSGRNWPEFEKRSACLDLEGKLKPDMASLTLSSLNFPNAASTNSPQMIQDLVAKMLRNGIKPELEVFDTGMINYARYLIKKNLIQPPYYFNILLGNIASAQANLVDAGYLMTTLPPDSYWAFGGIGTAQLKINTLALASGGGIRIGLEDNLYMDDDRTSLATNTSLLERITKIADLLKLKPYTPREARQALNLTI